MALSEAKINEFYTTFVDELNNAGIDADKIVNFLGEDKIKAAPAGLETKSGLAFPGALLFLIIRALEQARKLWTATSTGKKNEDGTVTYVNNFDIDQKSLDKVMLLHQLGKVMMYEQNDDEWQVNKRGVIYKWVDNETTINCGERSQYICQKVGIELTEPEFEAMKINDKNDEDRFSMLHIQPISMLVKMADDLTYMRVNVINKKSKK